MLEGITSIDLIRLCVLLLAGIFLSYKDIREGKVYNSHLAFLFIAGIVLFLMGGRLDLLLPLGINFFLSLLIGIVFWQLGYWGAGDAKLLAVCSIYMPFYKYEVFFASQLILMNTLALGFLIWFAPVFFKTSLLEKKQALKATITPSLILTTALAVFGLFYWISKVFTSLGLGMLVEGYIISLVLSILIFMVLRSALAGRSIILLVALAAARIFYEASFLSLVYWEFFFLAMLLILFSLWFGNLSFYVSYKEKRPDDLKEGDIPIGISLKGGGSDLNGFLARYFRNVPEILKRGFSRDDINKLKRSRKVEVFIIKGFVSFTPILIASTLIAYFMSGDIILYIISLAYFFLE